MESAAEKLIIDLLQEIKHEQQTLKQRLDKMDTTLEFVASSLCIRPQTKTELTLPTFENLDTETIGFENLQQFWNAVLLHVHKKVSAPSFATWIQPTNLLAYDESSATITIEAPNKFAREWLATHYTQLIQGIIKQLTNKEVRIQFTVQINE